MKNEEVHTFLNDIRPKVNVLARLEFDHAYFDVAVQHISHYAMGTLPFHGFKYLLLFIIVIYLYKDIWS